MFGPERFKRHHTDADIVMKTWGGRRTQDGAVVFPSSGAGRIHPGGHSGHGMARYSFRGTDGPSEHLSASGCGKQLGK